MIKALLARIKQKHRTIAWPRRDVTMPDRLRGLPHFDVSRCPPGCRLCLEACPTGAIRCSPDAASASADGPLRVDLGRCLFCTDCANACPHGALKFTNDYRLAVRRRQDLELTGETLRLAQALDARARSLFGRSLRLRQVSAGGCNACEADVNVLTTIGFDLGRFGIQFVASPRHADGLLITGPVPQNMRLALQKTYDAVPPPKLVIAVGACAISGGPFRDHAEVSNGATDILPVDLFVPGCPPHPMTTLDGLLRLLGRIGD